MGVSVDSAGGDADSLRVRAVSRLVALLYVHDCIFAGHAVVDAILGGLLGSWLP